MDTRYTLYLYVLHNFSTTLCARNLIRPVIIYIITLYTYRLTHIIVLSTCVLLRHSGRFHRYNIICSISYIYLEQVRLPLKVEPIIIMIFLSVSQPSHPSGFVQLFLWATRQRNRTERRKKIIFSLMRLPFRISQSSTRVHILLTSE